MNQTPRKSSSHQSPRILLVDDNEHGNAARKALLEEEGFSVECALSGEDAWEMFEQTPPDLIVTDLKMERNRMNGLELIARVRASAHPVPTILLSAWAACMGLTEETSGADAILSKSNKEQDYLTRTIRHLLARRSRRKPPASQKPARTSVARSG